MSNLHEYKSVVDEKLHSRIFLKNLTDLNISINRPFSSTIQQLFIVRNWETLSKTISQEELWAYLKIYEYRLSDIVFDEKTGNLIADENAKDLYKNYYYNSLILSSFDFSKRFNIYNILCVIVLFFIFVYITSIWRRKHKINALNVSGLLNLLETSTRAQQW